MNHSGDQLVDPKLLFLKTHMQEGLHIADFGCGRTGHMVFPAAPIIGDSGMIYAVDILKDVLQNIDKRAKHLAFTNVYTVWSDVENVGKTAIPEKSLDIIFMVNILSQSSNRHAILLEAERLLKPKGRILVVDWKTEGLPFSPCKETCVDMENIAKWGRMTGFAVQEIFDVGTYHDGIILYRND